MNLLAGFNANLVRLKAHLTPGVLDVVIGFNANLVRLKGSTTTWNNLGLIRFNANLVRLKAEANEQKAWLLRQRFNANLVRLKGMPRPFYLFLIPGFNANLVRLKGPTHRLMSSAAEEFQCKSGSIKSCTAIIMDAATYCFNANLVRLKGIIDQNDIERKQFVSMPIWFD